MQENFAELTVFLPVSQYVKVEDEAAEENRTPESTASFLLSEWVMATSAGKNAGRGSVGNLRSEGAGIPRRSRRGTGQGTGIWEKGRGMRDEGSVLQGGAVGRACEAETGDGIDECGGQQDGECTGKGGCK